MRASRRKNGIMKMFGGLPKWSDGRGRVEVITEFFTGV
jgi:hypothetical protein